MSITFLWAHKIRDSVFEKCHESFLAASNKWSFKNEHIYKITYIHNLEYPP